MRTKGCFAIGWTVGALALASVLPAMAGGVADAAGDWLHPENGAVLQTYECEGDLCIRIAKASKPGLLDAKNPDDALKSRPMDGIVILDHAKSKSENSWEGKLYNAQDGKTYTGIITLLSPAQLQMKGCWLTVFCKTIMVSKIPAQ
jgi:uncharacterized protein (DUF2147 family)